MMTAQIANGGYAIKPKIIVDSNPISYEDAKQSMESGLLFDAGSEELFVGLKEMLCLLERWGLEIAQQLRCCLQDSQTTIFLPALVLELVCLVLI